MRRLFTPAFVILALLAPSVDAADTWVVDRVHSEVSFQIRHLVSKVRGRFTDFSGTIHAEAAKPEASSVEFAIKAASIDTGAERRDTHLRSADFFDVEKYPEITFKSSKVKAVSKDRYEVTGTFSMHGVSKEITLPVTYVGVVKDNRGNEKAGFETQVTLNRKDYGIVWNQTADAGGVVLGDDVAVTINLETGRPRPPSPSPSANP